MESSTQQAGTLRRGRVKDQPQDPGKEPRPSRLPVFLSALVCPGLGQIAQRRWVAAVFVIGGFAVTFVIFIIGSVRAIGAYYALAFGDGMGPKHPLPVRRTLIMFGLSLFFYVWGILDAHWGYMKECAAWRQRNFRAPVPPLPGEGDEEKSC